jgi:hypothetical protein
MKPSAMRVCIDGTVKQGAVQLISINIPRTVKTDIFEKLYLCLIEKK